ncbi:MAG: 2-hydroxyacid dehydrogenase [Rubrivivax sp.]|nr:2-hydroxyacid dehydrogenase [Rubrivivax sp.]
MPAIEILTASRLPPLYFDRLKTDYVVHERLHDTDPAALQAAAPRIRAIAASGESKVPGELMARLPRLEIVSVMGVGYDGVDVAAAKARGVMVTHTPDVLNDEVADTAIGLMLCAARQLPAADRYVRAGQWLNGPMPLARKMSGSRLGLVGMGRIGKAIAHRALAFGMSIAYTARSAKAELPYRFEPSAKALAAASDFLVVITPGGAGTRKLIDAEVLAALGPKGILVNVARGSVVDEAALVEALTSGKLGGAALDVFENEPNVPQALIDLPHVVLAPHIGSATRETRQAMADLALANLKAHFEGRPVLTAVPELRAAKA